MSSKKDKKAKKSKTKSSDASLNVPLEGGLWFFPSKSCAENLSAVLANEAGKKEMKVVEGTPSASSEPLTVPMLPALVNKDGSRTSVVFGAVNVLRFLLDGQLSVVEDDLVEIVGLHLLRSSAAEALKANPAIASTPIGTLAKAAPHEGSVIPPAQGLQDADTVVQKLQAGSAVLTALTPLMVHAVLAAGAGMASASLVSVIEREAKTIATATAQLEAAQAWSPLIPCVRALPSAASADGLDLTGGILHALKNIFTRAIAQALPEIASHVPGTTQADSTAKISYCSDAKMGDFQCNSAMAICKLLKSIPDKKLASTMPVSPRDVAEHIVAAVPPTPLIQRVTNVNGFINITLADMPLKDAVLGVNQNGVQAPATEPRTVLVDFSSPNIAKDMHVGHLRSTILGDSVCRIMEFSGHDVKRVNHVGDWGTQFGMLITYMKEEYPDLDKERPNIQDLTALYKASKKRFDEDPVFKETSRNNVVKLQSGDAESRKIWNLLCDVSRAEFQIIYDALGVRLEEFGESFYNPMIPPTIDELKAKGLVVEDQTKGCEGMLIIKLPHFDIPLIMRKSDGGYGYDSTDMAALRYRTQTLDAKWIIYITDAGQGGHFHMCFDAGKVAGWTEGVRLDHLGFGVVCGEDGGKFKTRSGTTVRLIDLLNESRDRMRESLEERAREGKCPLNAQEIEAAATKIGYGAVKYFDMKQDMATNYVFSYDRMLSTSGNTAVYLMFAYARIASIIRKAEAERGINMTEVIAAASSTLVLGEPCERALALRLMQFDEVMRLLQRDLTPNKLTDYLYDVASDFTTFVTQVHVLNSEEIKSRLLLCDAAKKIMAKCFYLLGIEPLERI